MGIEEEFRDAQKGDWEKFYRTLEAFTCHTASKYHIKKQDHSDILQSVLVKVLGKMDEIEYGSYITQAIKYEILNYIRDVNYDEEKNKDWYNERVSHS